MKRKTLLRPCLCSMPRKSTSAARSVNCGSLDLLSKCPLVSWKYPDNREFEPAPADVLASPWFYRAREKRIFAGCTMPGMFQSMRRKSRLAEVKASLEQRRIEFRRRLGPSPPALWSQFSGRIGAVLSGGGARGAYEAGVLLAFQDAGLPTHILTATSIGSINAAGYAANSTGYVGNA